MKKPTISVVCKFKEDGKTFYEKIRQLLRNTGKK